MQKNTLFFNFWLSIALMVLLSACGAPATNVQEPDPGEVATVVAATMEALTPATTSEPPAQKTNPENLTIIQPPPAQDSDSDVPVTTQEPEPPITYTAGDSTCERTGVVPETGGGGGQAIFPPFDPGNALVMKTSSVGLAGTSALIFSPAGEQILTIGAENALLWEATTGEQLARVAISGSDAAFSPDGQTAVLGTWNGEVLLWDLESGEHRQVSRDEGNYPKKVAISPDGNWIAASYTPADQSLETWDNPSLVLLIDARSGEIVQRYEGQLLAKTEVRPGFYQGTYASGHFFEINSVQFSPDGQALLTAGNDAAIRLWDVASGEHLRCFESPHQDERDLYQDQIMSATFSPDGRRVLGLLSHINNDEVGLSSSVLIWDALTGQLERTLHYPLYLSEGNQNFTSATFGPHGQAIITTGSDNLVLRWDAGSGQMLQAMRHSAPVEAARIGPLGRRVASAFTESNESPAGSLWLWDLNHPSLTATANTYLRLEQAYSAFREARIDEAFALVNEAAAIDPDPGASARYQIEACRYAAVWGWPAQALPTCQQAITLAGSYQNTPTRLRAHESHAIALAQSGDLAGASRELEICLSLAREDGGVFYTGDWEQWLPRLRDGENPFAGWNLYYLRLPYLPPANQSNPTPAPNG